MRIRQVRNYFLLILSIGLLIYRIFNIISLAKLDDDDYVFERYLLLAWIIIQIVVLFVIIYYCCKDIRLTSQKKIKG